VARNATETGLQANPALLQELAIKATNSLLLRNGGHNVSRVLCRQLVVEPNEVGEPPADVHGGVVIVRGGGLDAEIRKEM